VICPLGISNCSQKDTQEIVEQRTPSTEQKIQLIVQDFNERTARLPVAMFLSALDGNCLAVNQAYCDLIDQPPEKICGFEWINNLHPDDKPGVLECVNSAIEQTEEYHGEHRYIRRDGECVHVKLDTVLIYENNQPIVHLATIANTTTSERLKSKVSENEAILTAMTNAMQEGIVVQKNKGEVVICNPAAEKILGLNTGQLMGRTSIDPRWRSIHEDGSDFPGDQHPAMVTLRTGESLTGITMGIHHPNGELRWISINSIPIRNSSREVTSVVATFVDISDQKTYMQLIDQQFTDLNEAQIELEMQREELETLNSKLRFQAETDGLTLLFNRRAITERLDSITLKVKSNTYGIVLFDIDHFKSINDTHGHDVGDQVLKLVASLASDAIPSGAAVGRFGGEEFLVVATDVTPSHLASIAEKIRNAFASCTDGPIAFTASFGTAHASSTQTPKNLLKIADENLYKAKNSGRNQVCSDTEIAA
jgi:diguanylate cyclase (GGDEF)-like protein/PAS domain S-box-containing protein